MENVKEELKKVILEVMLPETQTYLEEINSAIASGSASEEDIEAKGDIEGFINELNTIVEVVETNEISDEDAQFVYDKIKSMLDEHEAEG